MVTTSEIAVTATIWVLTVAGGFFGTRAMVRRNKAIRVRQESDTGKQSKTGSTRDFQ